MKSPTNKKKPSKKREDKCPYCGGEIFIVHSSKIYGEGHDYGAMQVCENWPTTCEAYAGFDSTLADEELRSYRKICHKNFDYVWQSKTMNRKAAYRWLGRVLKKPPHLAHIALLNKEECEKLLDEIDKLPTHE